jgi:hypothetical protein
LEQATTFTFHDEVGHFTAHKTRAGNRRGGVYWRATRRLHGRLFSYYLGPSARLTGEHVRQAAHALAAGSAKRTWRSRRPMTWCPTSPTASTLCPWLPSASPTSCFQLCSGNGAAGG